MQQSCDKVALIPKINRRIFLIMSGGLLLPAVHRVFAKQKNETMNNRYDAIIVGGSFAGLAAAMTLGRSLRKALVLDTDKPCNRFTIHAHNVLTHDGEPPASIKEKVLKELLNYSTVEIRKQEALHVSKTDAGFIIATANENYECRKLIFATGMRDILPDIDGAAACWGKTLLHCPYCHGYEVRGEPTMILATAKDIPEMVKLLSQWTKQLYACATDGKLLDASFLQLCEEKGVQVIGKHVQRIAHTNGRVSAVCFNDGTQQQVSVIYGRFPMEQHAVLPVSVGCVLTDMGLIKVDMMGQTTVSGVYAAGDCISPFRTIHTAMASGTMAGAAVNKELIELEF